MMKSRMFAAPFPDAVTVLGKSYPVHTDFRRWATLESLLFDEQADFVQTLPQILRLCYRQLPPTLEKAIDGVLWFYACGEEGTNGGGSGRPTYSFVQDEMLIYAAFYQQYGIDLTTAELHWWQFRALLSGLSENTFFSRVVGFRGLDLSKIKNAEDKRFFMKMKRLYRLKDTKSEAEREVEVYAALQSLF